MEHPNSSTLHIKTLGGLSIELDGRPITTFVSTKAEALLIYLVCNPRQHPRETLADLLWDDRTQRQAMSNLRTVLYSLRKEVGQYVDITRKTAAINPESNLAIDAFLLETAIPTGGIQSAEQARAAEQALALYNGDFLAGFFLPEAAGFESWVAAQRENLHRQFVDASLQLGRYHLDHQQYPAAIATTTRLLQIDPLAEAGHRQLMEALARNNKRTEALAQYKICRQILDDELGLDPDPETVALFDTIKTSSLPTREISVNNDSIYGPSRPTLPPQSILILGRKKEIDDIKELLTNSTQLVTIVAPGGMGKSLLALEITHQLTNHFDDGAAYVSLAPLSAPDAVLPAMAKAIQFELQGSHSLLEQLIDHIHEKKLLLTVDNFEHLLDAAPILGDIVKSAPNVKLLVTSRERLKLQVEQVYILNGLFLTDWATIDESKQDPAVQLFLHHAQRVRPAFDLRQEHLQPLQELFQLVGGMPLAIILAAGWIEVLGPAEILAEIGRNLDLLEANMRDIPDRHQSMRAVFDGTWNRLNDREQQIFAALSVFRGGFTLEAAREIAQATPRDLMKLLDQSLLIRAEGGRFELHELLRQFAAQELGRSVDQKTAVYQFHSQYYCTFLKTREESQRGSQRNLVEAEIAADIENIFIAWNWAADNSPKLIFLSQTSLGRYASYAYGRGRKGSIEVIIYAQSKLSNLHSENPKEMAELLTWAGKYSREDINNSADYFLEQANKWLEIAENNGLDIRSERAFLLLVMSDMWEHKLENRIKYLETSHSLYKELGRSWEMATILGTLAFYHHTSTKYKKADEYFQQSVELYETLGDQKPALQTKELMAMNKAWAGNLDDAESLYKACLNAGHESGDLRRIFSSLSGLGIVLLYLGRFEDSITNLDKSHRLFKKWGVESYWYNRSWSLLHLGRYDESLNQIEPILKGDVEIRKISDYFLGIALFLKGCQLLAIDDVGQAKNHFEESVSSISIYNSNVGQQDEAAWSRVGLIYVAIQNGNLNEAQNHLIEILELNLFLPLIQALPAAALLMAELGNTERAIELHAHALTHPFIANSQWFKDVALDKLDALAATLPPETLAAAQKHGRFLDLWQTAESLLEELKGLPQ